MANTSERKPRKRGNGEGSVFHLQDGRWRAAVTTGMDAAGKPKRKVFTAATRHEVAAKLSNALRDQQHGFNIDPQKRTLGDFLKSWLEGIKPNVAPATYVSYEGAVRLHLTPALGKVLLTRLQAEHILQFKTAKLETAVTSGPGVKKPAKGKPEPEPRHLSARTVRYFMLILRMALHEACKLDLVTRNVAELVDFPKGQVAEIQPYTPEEASAFVEASKGHRLGALFSAAMALGLRKGEALALQWPAIDLERGTLTVRLTLQRIKLPGEKKGHLILKEPKRSSKRTLNVPKVIVSELANWRRRQEQERALAGRRWKDTGFVFTTGIGTPLEPRNIERAFSEIRTIGGLRRIRIHDLRHTAATILLAQGVHPRVVMELLGHSQIAITMNTYSHVVPALRKDAADQMELALNPPPKSGVATLVATKPPSGIPN